MLMTNKTWTFRKLNGFRETSVKIWSTTSLQGDEYFLYVIWNVLQQLLNKYLDLYLSLKPQTENFQDS